MTTFLNAASPSAQQTVPNLSMRCPACRQLGSFEGIGQDLFLIAPGGPWTVGHRRCPNPACHTHVFVVFDNASFTVTASYPPEVIDFDSTNVPPNVVAALEEAIKCHANECY